MSTILDYNTDAGKLGMAFVLLRLERKGELSTQERQELDALSVEFKAWTPKRRHNRRCRAS